MKKRKLKKDRSRRIQKSPWKKTSRYHSTVIEYFTFIDQVLIYQINLNEKESGLYHSSRETDAIRPLF